MLVQINVIKLFKKCGGIIKIAKKRINLLNSIFDFELCKSGIFKKKE